MHWISDGRSWILEGGTPSPTADYLLEHVPPSASLSAAQFLNLEMIATASSCEDSLAIS